MSDTDLTSPSRAGRTEHGELRVHGDCLEASLKIILAMLPDDLDALNFLGHIERTRGNLGAAENRQKQPYERMS